MIYLKKYFLFLSILISTSLFANNIVGVTEYQKNEAEKTVKSFLIGLEKLHENFIEGKKHIVNSISSVESRSVNFIEGNDNLITFRSLISKIGKMRVVVAHIPTVKEFNYYTFQKNDIGGYIIESRIAVPVTIIYNNKKINLNLFVNTLNNKIINLKEDIPDWAVVFDNNDKKIRDGNDKKLFDFHLQKANKGSLADIIDIAEAFLYGRYGVKKDEDEAIQYFIKANGVKKNIIASYNLGILWFKKGDLYRDLGDLSNKKYYNLKALNMFEQVISLETNKYLITVSQEDLLIAKSRYILGYMCIYWYEDFQIQQDIETGINLMFNSARRYNPEATTQIAEWLFRIIPKAKSNSTSYLDDTDKKIFYSLKNKKIDWLGREADVLSYDFLSDLLLSVALNNAEAKKMWGDLYCINEYKDYSLKNAVFYYEDALKTFNNTYDIYKIKSKVTYQWDHRYILYESILSSLTSTCVNYGKTCYNKNNYNEAYKYLIKAANLDNDEAQYLIGSMYENGIGLKADISKAKYWYTKAAAGEYGNEDAKIALEYLNN